MAAQPKKKISRVRGRTRRAHSAIKLPKLAKCQHCGHLKPAHIVCDECGFYGNRKILTTKTDKRISQKLKAEKRAEMFKAKTKTKKPAKKTAKSAKPKQKTTTPKPKSSKSDTNTS